MKRTSLFCLPVIFLLSGCFTPQHALYVSPFHGNSQEYHTLPLVTDTASTAIYVRGGYSGGKANDNSTDHLHGGDLSIYAAHHFGQFQCFYGLDAALGNYRAGSYDSSYDFWWLGQGSTPPYYANRLDSSAGPKTFGSTGFSGGINLVMPFRNGEWRAIGVETALHYEFGDYLSFRKWVPDSIVTYVARSSFYGTFGFTTEIIGRVKDGEYGFRVALGYEMGTEYRPRDANKYFDYVHLNYGSYLNLAFHFTYQRYTAYIQTESAYKGSSIHLGLAYRLTRPKIPPKDPFPSIQSHGRHYGDGPRPIHPD